MTRHLHDPGEQPAAKGTRRSGLPNRLGGFGAGPTADLTERGKAENTGDGAGVIYIHGDPDIVAEVRYHVRHQSGGGWGAGKRIKALGTTVGLPDGESRAGEVTDAKSDPIESGDVGIVRRRKLGATE